MFAVSRGFLTALRHPHTVAVRVEAWRGGVKLTDVPLHVMDGAVDAAAGRTSSPRRTLRLELAPEPGVWDGLAPHGTTLKVWRGIRYVDGSTEYAKLGVFDVDEQSLSYSAQGGVGITAPDKWVRVQRARFEAPEYTSGSALNEAVRLVVGAGLARGTIAGRTTVVARSATWPRDREEAAETLARTAGAWIYADLNGKVSTRPIPSIRQTPVWTVDASGFGVMLDASRSRNRQRTFNVVVLVADAPDGSGPFLRTVTDDDPASPTYVAGPFGRVPFFWNSQLVVDTSDADRAGRAFLRRLTGLAAQLQLTSVVNPALEPGDVITVLLPERAGENRVVERHLIDGVTIPLTADGTQDLVTRSNRPEGSLPEEFGEDVYETLVTDDGS